VVSIDVDEDLIAIQHFDGEREEIDSGEWVEMDLDRAEAPEDWIPPAGDDDDGDWRDREEKDAKKDEDEEDEEDWDEDEDDDEEDDVDDDDSRDDY